MRENTGYFDTILAPPENRKSLFSKLSAVVSGKLRSAALIVGTLLLVAVSVLALGIFQIAVLYTSDSFGIFPIHAFFIGNALLGVFLISFVLLSRRFAQSSRGFSFVSMSRWKERLYAFSRNINVPFAARRPVAADSKQKAVLLIITRDEVKKPKSRSAAA